MSKKLFTQRMFVWPLAMMPAWTVGTILVGWLLQGVSPEFLEFLCAASDDITTGQKVTGFICLIICCLVALAILLWPAFVGNRLGRSYRGGGEGKAWLWSIYGIVGFTFLAYLYLSILMGLGWFLRGITA